MIQLVKTVRSGKGRGAHSHILYLNDEAKTGVSSTNHDHSHQLMWVEAVPFQPAEYDELGNLVREQVEESPGYWQVLPAADGHTHEEWDEVPVTNPFADNREDSEIVAEVVQLFQAATEIETESLEDGEEAEEFASGVQWSPDEQTKLSEQERACLTLNYIEHQIDELCGYQRNQRTDFKYLPQESSDQVKADIFNIIAKHVCDKCNYAHEESDQFEDQAIVGRGVVALDVSFDDDLRGDIKIKHVPWKDVRFGPHKKRDLSDLEYCVIHRMYSFAQLERMFPDVAEEIRVAAESVETLTGNDRTTADDKFSGEWRYPAVVGGLEMHNVSRKEVRVLECQRKVFVRASVIARPADDFYLNALGWSKQDLDSVRTIPGFRVVERTMHKIRITKVCRGVVLADENPADLPDDDFYLAVAYAKKRGDRFWGKVRRVIDPQRELNKRRSQAMDFGNRALGGGWFFDHTTFPENEKQKFQKRASRAGFFQEVSDVGRLPQKSDGTPIPPEIMELSAVAQQTIRDLISVQVEAQGANDSGSKLLTLEQMKLRGNEFLFDNLSLSKIRVGRLLLGLIKRYWSPDRVARLLMAKQDREGLMLGGQPVSEFSQEQIAQIYEETEVESLDVVVSEVAASPSVKTATFLMFKEMASEGVPVPPDILVRLAPIPESEKQQVMSALQQQSETANQAEQIKADAEIKKTLIAHGQIPQDVSQQYGLQVQGGLGEAPAPVTEGGVNVGPGPGEQPIG